MKLLEGLINERIIDYFFDIISKDIQKLAVKMLKGLWSYVERNISILVSSSHQFAWSLVNIFLKNFGYLNIFLKDLVTPLIQALSILKK